MSQGGPVGVTLVGEASLEEALQDVADGKTNEIALVIEGEGPSGWKVIGERCVVKQTLLRRQGNFDPELGSNIGDYVLVVTTDSEASLVQAITSQNDYGTEGKPVNWRRFTTLTNPDPEY